MLLHCHFIAGKRGYGMAVFYKKCVIIYEKTNLQYFIIHILRDITGAVGDLSVSIDAEYGT